MNWITVESSWIEAIAHDADKHEAFVRFNGGAEWKYVGVKNDMFETWKASPSKGKFFGTFIQGSYMGVKVSGGVAVPVDEHKKIVTPVYLTLLQVKKHYKNTTFNGRQVPYTVWTLTGRPRTGTGASLCEKALAVWNEIGHGKLTLENLELAINHAREKKL